MTKAHCRRLYFIIWGKKLEIKKYVCVVYCVTNQQHAALHSGKMDHGEQNGLCDKALRVFGGASLLERWLEPRRKRARIWEMYQPIWPRAQLHARCDRQRAARPNHRYDHEYGRAEGAGRRGARGIRSQAPERGHA